jgi:hypothetical protein
MGGLRGDSAESVVFCGHLRISWSQCEFHSLLWGYFLLLEESQKQGIIS